jgi:hypothetical protein
MRLSRRELVRVLLGGACGSLLGACQAPSPAAPTAAPAPAPTAVNPLVKPRASGAELTVVQASSELAQGRNRFAVGLIDARNQPVVAGGVRVEFFKLLSNGAAEKRADASAVFRSVGGASKGVWVAPAEFPEAGGWGAQLTLEPPNDTPKVARMNFDVRPKFSAPGYGDPAPRSVSPTDRDVNGDTSHICSNVPPCALHAMTIADALMPGQKPLILLFATPALCTSATCAPELDAVQQLHSTYAEQANFIHVEIYQYPFDAQRVAKTVDEWHLPSDPWTFIVDKTGVVRDRFEGAAPIEELEPALKAVLS